MKNNKRQIRNLDLISTVKVVKTDQNRMPYVQSTARGGRWTVNSAESKDDACIKQ